MKILMTHGWVRGNLGDFCLARRCVQALRVEFPESVIDFVSIPDRESGLKKAIAPLVDRYREFSYSRDLQREFRNYAAVVNTPGGGLQIENDARGRIMLRDAAACSAMGVPHVFAGHSFHPSFETRSLGGSCIIAREPASHAHLKTNGLDAALAADPAFLEPLPEISRKNTSDKVLLFLRHDHFKDIRLSAPALRRPSALEERSSGRTPLSPALRRPSALGERSSGRTLLVDGRRVSLPEGELTLASSDMLRDGPLLRKLAAAWKVPYLPSPDLGHLLKTIGEARHVISDRYHPVIFSHMFGVPSTFLPRVGSLRDKGLQILLREKAASECAVMAREGFERMADFLHARADFAVQA